MNCLMRFLFILTLSSVRTDVTDMWNSFKTNVGIINKTNLFIQYEKVCPILTNEYKWRKIKDLRVQKGDCFLENCKDELNCQLSHSCCHNSTYGYLATSIFDPSVYVLHGKYKHYLIVNRCPYDEIDETKFRCERLGAKPVTSISTRIVYKNLFCANCHGEQETIDWKLEFDCPTTNRAKTKHTLLNDCNILYKPLRPLKASLNVVEPSVQRFEDHSLISACNETGLWKDYDRDVEWACRRFKRPYKHFKNLYCYICNPSIVSTQPVDKKSFISACNNDSSNSAENNKSEKFSDMNASLAEMCKFSDIEPRLSPYRNVYCLLCQGSLNEHIHPNIGFLTIQNIEAKSFLLKITLAKEMNNTFTTNTFRKGIENLLKLFKNNAKDIEVPVENFAGKIQRDMELSIRNQKKLIEAWTILCPYDQVCTQPYQNDNVLTWTIWKNKCSSLCTCNQTCLFSRKFKCCFDRLVKYDVHTCLQESYFPVVMNTNLETSEDGEKSHRVIDKCLTGLEDSNDSNYCDNDDQSDLIMNIPVATNDIRISPFKNIKCALCNMDTYDINIFLRVQCKKMFETGILPTILHVIEQIKYHDCKVSFALNDRSLSYGKCDLDIKTIVKKELDFVCFNETMITGKGTDIEKICMANEIPNVIKSKSQKFVNCEECKKVLGTRSATTGAVIQCRRNNNTVISSEHLCFVVNEEPMEDARTNSNPEEINTYRSLFTVSEVDFERLTQMKYKQCPQGTFDIKMGLCRRLYCSSGRILENGSCINLFESVVDTMFLFQLTLMSCKMSKPSNETNLRNDESSAKTGTLGTKIEVNSREIGKRIYKTVEKIFQNETAFIYVHCHVEVYDCETKTQNKQNDSGVFNISDRTRIRVNVSVLVRSSKQKSHIESQLHGLTSGHVFHVSPVDLCPETLSRTYIKDEILCQEQSFTLPNNTYGYENTSYDHVNVKKSLFCPLVKIRVTNTSTNRADGNIIFNYLQHELSVPLASVDAIKTVNLATTLWICKDDLHLPMQVYKKHEHESKLQRVYFLFSTSCNIVSLLSLVVTLLTYSLFKVLRTVPGKNNMNLAFCLLLAQASLQLPHDSSNTTTRGQNLQCQTIAVCVHYFWLATFCALHVCSFHMYKVFSGRLMLFNRQTNSVFPKYTLYVYGSPLLIILATLSVNLATRGSIGFGVNRCFLDDFYSVIAAFLVPSCLMFLSNAIFYIRTFYIIYNSPTLRCNIEERGTFAIYVKLCTITGMTWPLLFIDALFPLSAFSFIATFTNAMQGFFIFISFIFNRRVLNLYKSSLSRQPEASTLSNNLETLSRVKSLSGSTQHIE